MSHARKKVGLLDYGVGNIESLKHVLEKLNCQVTIGQTEESLYGMDTIILPGVGSFTYAMDNLQSSGMDRFIKKLFSKNEVTVIGICLGMQILFETSEEGACDGLGILEGTVHRFRQNECHVGWNVVHTSQESVVENHSAYYFNHSYYVRCSSELSLASTSHQHNFPAAVRNQKFYGFQFHPEKSQNAGEHLLKTIIGDC